MATGGIPNVTDQHDLNMERQLTCSVCLDLFTEPLLLPCLHSLCRRCVEAMMNKGRYTTHVIKCPECTSVVDMKSLGIKSLKRNYPLNNMVDIYKVSCQRRVQNATNETNIISGNNQRQEDPVAQRSALAPSAPEDEEMVQTNHGLVPSTEATRGKLVSQQAGRGDHTTTPASYSRCSPGQNPKTCSVCSESKLAAILCKTCDGMAFCKTCLSIYHPPEIGHDVMLLETEPRGGRQSDKCPLCDGSTLAAVRCLECGMTFCNGCLHSFHPTTHTAPGHTLVEIREMRPISRPGSGEQRTTNRRSTGRSSLDRLSGSSNDMIDVAATLAHLAVETSCVNCPGSTSNLASLKCLTCERFMCKECAKQHVSTHPDHSVIDMSLGNNDEQVEAPHGAETGAAVPDVQLKLIDLMNIRADVMTELLSVLTVRRDLLESTLDS